MIKLSADALVLSLEIILTNCLSRGLFPETWKCANVVPVHKKHEKMLRGITILFLFYQSLGKYLKSSFDSLFSHLAVYHARKSCNQYKIRLERKKA